MNSRQITFAIVSITFHALVAICILLKAVPFRFELFLLMLLLSIIFLPFWAIYILVTSNNLSKFSNLQLVVFWLSIVCGFLPWGYALMILMTLFPGHAPGG